MPIRQYIEEKYGRGLVPGGRLTVFWFQKMMQVRSIWPWDVRKMDSNYYLSWVHAQWPDGADPDAPNLYAHDLEGDSDACKVALLRGIRMRSRLWFVSLSFELGMPAVCIAAGWLALGIGGAIGFGIVGLILGIVIGVVGTDWLAMKYFVKVREWQQEALLLKRAGLPYDDTFLRF